MFNIMVMNKDISSILLLVVIGFVIYCLSNNENNKPKKEVEILLQRRETIGNQIKTL